MFLYGTSSYIQVALNKAPLNILVDETEYQNTLLQLRVPTVAADQSIALDIQQPMLSVQPETKLSAVFNGVGELQQTILDSVALETATINPIACSITEASLQISGSLSSVINTDSYLEQLVAPSYAGWLNPDNVINSDVLSDSVASRMTSVLGTSIAADNAFLSFDPSKIYEIPGVHRDIAELSIDSLNGLAKEYKSLCADSYSDNNSIIGSSSLVVEHPPFEVYQAGTLAQYIAPVEVSEAEVELIKPREIIRAPTDIRDKILSLGESFLGMYDGAVDAMNATSADSQRHMCVSLRELITHTIHELAPVNEAKEYLETRGDAEQYFHEGRPTRKGRILYICREIERGNFSKFVNADVKSTLAFMDLLQEGTHSREMHYTEPQLTTLLSRAEGLVSFLIDISSV